MNPSVQLSELDTKRYGYRIARAAAVTAENLSDTLAFCHSHNVAMLIARCPTDDFPAIHAMEHAGFLLMDTLVYYSVKFARTPIPDNPITVSIRFVQPGDEVQVEQVARDSFKGYYGHYHADPRLDSAAADEAYVEWAVRSCVSRDVADEVLIAYEDSQILGFATLRQNSPEEGEGVLFGVTPSAQGRGIYQSFMINGMRWSQQRGATQMIVSTQVTNIAVQKVWARLGFTMSNSYYTFHKWFV